MTTFNTSMRLKANRDTFYIPDPVGGVFFRNNSSSFRMEGEGIDQWVEKLMPVFNGEHSLAELTDGLPEPHRRRALEIAEVLMRNGYVRDVSQEAQCELAEGLAAKYAAQIEFFDHFGGSGASRFQAYRQKKVLAAGSGPIMASLAAALLESGLPNIRALFTSPDTAGRKRLAELAAHARQTDEEASFEEVRLPAGTEDGWREAVKPFDAVLYVSQEGNIDELRSVHAACRKESKLFVPAFCLDHVGWAGPLVHGEAAGDWESAWRRAHRTALSRKTAHGSFSPTSGALLANVIVFEGFKKLGGVSGDAQENRLFLLDLETLEGAWHPFLPHPATAGQVKAEWVSDAAREPDKEERPNEDGLLAFFSGLTSETTGIFHLWEEGKLVQLPLSQCRVQPADPLSEGPAELLAEIVCGEMTHTEARHAAGLSGIEAYAARMSGLFLKKLASDPRNAVMPQDCVGVGAGATVAEGVGRGLHKWLNEELGRQCREREPSVYAAVPAEMEDERCRYFWQALRTINGEPKLGLGEEVAGFPSVWVGTNGGWFGAAGLNVTFALRNALKQALMKEQSGADAFSGLELASVNRRTEEEFNVVISKCGMAVQAEELEAARQIAQRNRRRLLVFDMTPEPSFKQAIAGVYGVLLQEEVSR